MNNKFLLQRKGVIPFLLAIITTIILIGGCAEPSSGSSSSSSAAVVTIPMLNYADINAVANSKFIRVYTTGSEFTSSTTFSNFAISPSGGATIDSNTGIITVLANEVNTAGTKYIVTADVTNSIEGAADVVTSATATFTLKVLAKDDVKALAEAPVYTAVAANATEGTVAVVEESDGTPSATIISGEVDSKIPAPQFGGLGDKPIANFIRYSLVQIASAGSSSISTKMDATDARGVAVKGISIDADTGIITVEASAREGISGTYKVYAEATGDYAGQQSATIKIIVTPRIPIAGTFSYGDDNKKIQVYGNATRYPLTWSADAVEGQIVAYTITNAPEGIRIDAASGEVRIAKEVSIGTYTITIVATGTGIFEGTQSVELTITIESKSISILNYGNENTVSVSRKAIANIPPLWDDSNTTAKYAVKEGESAPEGVSLNATTGMLTINGAEVVSGAVVNIEATGSGNYIGSKEIKVTIQRTDLVIAGAFSYNNGATAIFEYGTQNTTYEATWLNEAKGQEVVYTISPKTAGITVGSDGLITVATTTALQEATEYTISAIGTGSYAGSIDTKLSIAVIARPGTLSYQNVTSNAVSIAYGATEATTYDTLWNNRTNNQTANYSISPTTAGISIDKVKGRISIATSTAVQAATDYTITVTGTGIFVGNVAETTLSIEITAKPIAGTVSYHNGEPATLVYGSGARYTAAWATEAETEISGQTVTYRISPETAGIEVNKTTGEITIAATAAAQAATEYTITATGTGNYSGNTTATLSIAITKALGTLHYGDAGAVSVFNTNAAYEVAPIWSEAGITATYEATETTGVAIAADTGKITIDGTAVANDTTVTITATGSGDYVGNTATADVTIKSVSQQITGTIIYTAISTTYGTEKVSAAPTWTGSTENQTVSYEISPQTAGITIADDGIITIAADATAQAETNYTVTARGKGDYAGLVKAENIKITIAAATIAAELSYGNNNVVNIDATLDSYTIEPTWSVAKITATYAGASTDTPLELAPGVTIDGTTGIISITVTALAIGNTTVSVTATGTGNYTGRVTVGTITLTKNEQTIAGELSYHEGTAANSTYGTTTTYSAKWEWAASGQTVSYSISPATAGISVDADGTITVANTTAVQSATDYTITATGTKAYKGSKTAKLSIAIAAKAVAGSFYYKNGAESFVFGTAKSYAVTTRWEDVSQSIEYTLSPSISGIDIDKTSGAITVADTVAAGTHALSITATGTGNYSGTLTAGLTLIITKSLGTLNYGASGVISVFSTASAYKVSPSWDEAGVTATYAVKDGTTAPAGVVLEADGTLTIDGSAVSNTATIEITATGSGVYSGTTEAEVTITKVNSEITGTLSYDAISTAYGISATQSPVWSGATSGQTQIYSLVPVVDGVSIDNKGVITIADTAQVAATTKYTVIAQGSGTFGGEITTKIDITINIATIIATLSYGTNNVATVLVNATDIITPTWSTNGITATYALKADTTLPVGIKLDGTTGVLTVIGRALADGDSKVSITATGIGNYTGTVDSAELTITKEKISITGILRYNDDEAASIAYDTGAVYKATWTASISGQVVSYSISPETTGITVGNDGTITVANSTAVQGATEYTITATGSGDYKGSIDSNKFSIAITAKVIDGVLSYGDKTETQGSISAVAYTPAWTTEPTESEQKENLAYSVSTDPNTNKVTINNVSGEVSLASDIAVGVYTVTVTANGTGNYEGSISSEFIISITLVLGDLSYGSDGVISVANNEAITIPPVWSIVQDKRSASYVAKDGATLPSGVTLNATTGVLTINGSTTDLNGKTATIVATGTGINAGQTSEASVTISVKTQQIAGSFSYSGILSTSYGTAKEFSPVWDNTATNEQTATYSISPEASGITVGSDGEVSVSATVAASGEYTVTAQGNGDFGGSISTKISIDIAPLAIAGTLSYADTTSFAQGTAGTSVATWSGKTSGQTVAYSISPATAGISIDSNGTIAVASTVMAGTYPLTVTAKGTGNYEDSVSASITLTVTGSIAGTLSYGTVGVLSAATSGTSVQAQWDGASTGQTLRYEFASSNATPTGISLDATTGALIVYGNTVVAGAYSIDAIGTGNYSGKITGELTIQTRTSEITGTFSYDTISTIYGTASTSSVPTWRGVEQSNQTLSYSISPETAGITVGSDGSISVAATTPAATTQYIITATGTESYAGTKLAFVSITIAPKAISGSIRYAATTLSAGSSETVDATLTLDDTDSTVSYAISSQDNGVSIDTRTGQVTIAPTSAAASKSYAITASAEGNYSGLITTAISITVNGALSGALRYPTSSIASAGGDITIYPEWTGVTAVQTYSYSVTPTTSANINTITGALTISAAGTYTITATGTELYTGSTKTTTILVQSVQSEIAGSFSYGGMTSIYGSDTTHEAPTWTGAGLSQTTNYTMTPNVAGISINASTGAIAVNSAANSGTYYFSVTATGTGGYAGNRQSVASVEVHKRAIAGALSYNETTATIGTPTITTVEWSTEAISGQTLEYSISPTTSGISIADSGAITIAPTSVFDSTTYTITAKGIDNYSGSTSGTISIKAIATLTGGFSYGTASVTTSAVTPAITSVQSTAVWIGADSEQSVTYAFDGSKPTGLELNSNTGTITIDGDKVTEGTYSVIATAVSGGLYTGSSTGIIQVIVATASITGRLDYGAISTTYGNGKTAIPIWANVVDTTQNVEYSISPVVEGIHIESATGVISVTNTANTLPKTNYTIRAKGAETYAGIILANIDITINQAALEGSINKTTLLAEAREKTIGAAPDWSNAAIDQLQTGNISYSLVTSLEGVIIDSETGVITVTEEAIPQITNIILSAQGQNNYIGSVTGVGTLKIIGSILGAKLQYQPLVAAREGTTTSTTSYAPDWIDLVEQDGKNYATYAFESANTKGLTISSTTGRVTVDGAIAIAGDYTVKATGTGFYTGTVYGTISIDISTNNIAGTFSYPRSASDATSISLLEATYGTASTTEAPTWVNAATDQKVNYSISPSTAGISIDSTTGVISIADTANIQIAREYTITAVGAKAEGFGGIIHTSLLIEVKGTAISSTVRYAATTTEYGTATTVAPSWTGAEPTVTYVLFSPPAGVSIDENTGLIRIANTVSATKTDTATATDITVYAVGTGNYSGRVSAILALTVTPTTTYEGELAYDAIIQTYGTKRTYQVTKVGVPAQQTGSYTITDADGNAFDEAAGISIESSGAITVSETAAVTTGAIEAKITMAGTGNYATSATLTTTVFISIIQINIANIALRYPDTVVPDTVDPADNIDLSPSWDLTSSDVTYALPNPTPAGLAIDANGTITITAATVAAGSYTITATGTGNYSGTQSTSLVLTKPGGTTTLSGTLSYADLVVAVDSTTLENNTSSPNGLTGNPTVSYSITPKQADSSIEGISIDSSSGTITVSYDATITLEPVEFTVTATGTDTTTGTKTADLSIHASYAICLLDNTITNGEITNWRQLDNIGKDESSLTGSYTLENDIVLPNAGQCSDYPSYGWSPIGMTITKEEDGSFTFKNANGEEYVYRWDGTAFKGTFDGKGHTISNFYMNRLGREGRQSSYEGLFGRLENATLKNFTLDHIGIKVESSGAIAGSAGGNTLVLENVRVTSSNNSPIYGTATIIGGLLQVGQITASVSSDSDLVIYPVYSSPLAGGLFGYIRDGQSFASNVSIDITGYYSGQITLDGNLVKTAENVTRVGAFIGQLISSNPTTIRGYYVSNSNGTLPIGGVITTEDNVPNQKIDMQVIIRSNAVNAAYDNVAAGSGDSFSGTPVVYNSINETYLTSANFAGSPTIGTDIAYSSSLSKDDFAELTFGVEVGEWTWVEDGKFPAINIGNTAPAAEQPIEFIGNVNALLDVSAIACTGGLHRPEVENSVYNISNWKELRWMDYCAAGDFVLTNDIHLPTPSSDPLYGVNGWHPLFTNTAFTGTLDGKGYAIRNFYANNELSAFGLISSATNATIKNLRIVHTGVTFGQGGVFVGTSNGVSLSNIGLEPTNDEMVSGTIETTNYKVSSGVLAGDMDNHSILRGYSTSKTNVNIAGIVGYARYTDVIAFTSNDNPFYTDTLKAHSNLVAFYSGKNEKVLKGYAISDKAVLTALPADGSLKTYFHQMYYRSTNTAAEGRISHLVTTKASNSTPIDTSTFTMTSTTTLAEFLADAANKGFRDTSDATKLDSDWVWVADGNWPAINLLHPDHRDTTAADYVAPLMSPADQPIGIQ